MSSDKMITRMNTLKAEREAQSRDPRRSEAGNRKPFTSKPTRSEPSSASKKGFENITIKDYLILSRIT